MKRIISAITTLLLCSSFIYSQEQSDIPKSNKANVILTDASIIPWVGIRTTMSYDFRFNEKNSGIGAKIGVGYVVGAGAPDIDAKLNWLLGGKGHYCDMGIGGMIGLGNYIFGSANLGYRFQPLSGHFVAKIGLSAIILSFDGILPGLEIGIGYKF